MRKATARKVILNKQKNKVKRREVTLANRPLGRGSLYEEIKSRGGVAHVCVIRSVGGIGDVLMMTPALRQLKREFPELKLTVAVDRHRTTTDTYYQLLHNAPFIDKVIDARYVERGHYHAVADISAVCIRYERRGLPPINRIDLFARACGIPSLRNKIPFYVVNPTERVVAQRKLSHYKKIGKKLIVLHTASFEDKRSWRVKNQIELIELTASESPEVQFLVLDFNRVLGDLGRYSNCLDISNTSVREMGAYIEAADLFIGPDSGPMHIAGALGIPSFVLFGSIPPAARINHYRSHQAIRLEGLSCLGCWYESCPIKIKCMRDITGKTIYDKIHREVLNG